MAQWKCKAKKIYRIWIGAQGCKAMAGRYFTQDAAMEEAKHLVKNYPGYGIVYIECKFLFGGWKQIGYVSPEPQFHETKR